MRVTIPQARELSKLREYTIHWRPDGNSLGDQKLHFAIASKYDPPRDRKISG